MTSKFLISASLASAAATWILGAASAIADPTPRDIRELLLADLRLYTGQDLANARAACVSGQVFAAKERFEREHGLESFPTAGEYCQTAIVTAVAQGDLSRLYYDLAAQQLELGVAFFSEGMRDAVGDAPLRIIANVRGAANAGAAEYQDAKGRAAPLGCPLALDVGATWAAANPTVVRHADVTPEQLQKLVAVCFDPEIGEVTLSTTGETFTIQQIGLLVGEQIARSALPENR